MELEHLKQLLLENPTLKIELSGHTDNQGTNAYNQRLSELRALSIYEWLLAQGIAAVRLSTKGYARPCLLRPTRPKRDVRKTDARN